MQRGLDRREQRSPGLRPGVLVTGESLGGSGRLSDELRVGNQLAHEALQRGDVAGFDEPARAVFLDVLGDDLPRRGDDR